MRKFVSVVVCAFYFAVPAFAEEGKRKAKEEHGRWTHQIKIINDVRSPVHISEVNLSISYKEPSNLRRLGRQLNRFGSGVDLMPYNYEINITSKGNSAVGVIYNILFYDSFNKHVDGSNLVFLPFQTNKKGRWGWHRKPPAGFRLYGMGCIFVRTVRLENGRIWNFNPKTVIGLLAKNKCGGYKTKEIRKHIYDTKKDNPVMTF